MCDQNMEYNREKFQKLLRSSLIAFGSDGAFLSEFVNDFKNDWQKDIYYYTRLLGYSDDLNGLIALMKSFPKDVIVEELPRCPVRFKPIPTEKTIDNLNLIDRSNKEIAENRERKARNARMNQRQPPISFRLSSIPPSSYAPRPFNQSQPIPLSHHQLVPSHLLLPHQRSYMPSKPRVIQIISENANLIDLGVRQPSFQRQNGDDRRSRDRTNSINGKENRTRNGGSSPPSFSRATTPRMTSLHSSANDLTELGQSEKELLMKIKNRPGQTFEPFQEDNDYFDEDFRTAASDGSATLTEASSRVGSVSSFNELVDPNMQSGNILDSEDEDIDVEEEDIDDFDDEDAESIVSDDSEYGSYICFDEFEETDELPEKENPVVCNYIDRLKDIFQPPQADLSRLLYLFQFNDGSLFSPKIDDFKRLYEKEFGCALSSKELNRLLRCPSNMRIVGESFKRASYPASSFFRVIQDKSSSQYTIKLRRCLTDDFVDPSIYFVRLPSSPNNKASSSGTNSLSKFSTSAGMSNHLMQSSVISQSTTTILEQPSTNSTAKTYLNSKLDFLQICSKVTSFLDKNGCGEVLLIELFEHLNKMSEFSIIKTKIELLGYLIEFLYEICEISIRGEEIFILDIRKNSKVINENKLGSTPSFNALHIGNKLEVRILSIVSNGDAKLELCQLSAKLKRLLNDYSDLLEILGHDQPTENLTPNSKRLVFFYDRSKRLRRGYIKKQESLMTVSVKDMDTLDTQEHLVPNDCVFDVPANFPMWRFPSCQLSAQIVEADMIQIRRFWKESTEFTVLVTDINGQKYICRPLGNNISDVDF